MPLNRYILASLIHEEKMYATVNLILDPKPDKVKGGAGSQMIVFDSLAYDMYLCPEKKVIEMPEKVEGRELKRNTVKRKLIKE